MFRHERGEQHVLEAHQGRDVRLLGEHDVALVVHGQPLEVLTVGREPQPVGTLQLADVDDAQDLACELRCLGDDAELRVLAGRSRIEVHRADEDLCPIEDRGLGVQAADRHSGEHEPFVAQDARRAELVEVHAGLEQFGPVARVAGMNQGLVVRCERVGEDRDFDIVLSQFAEGRDTPRSRDEVR